MALCVKKLLRSGKVKSKRGVLYGVLNVARSLVCLIACRSKFHSLNSAVVVSLFQWNVAVMGDHDWG